MTAPAPEAPETAPSLEVLAEYAGSSNPTSVYLAACRTDAIAMVADYITRNGDETTQVPAHAQSRAVLEVAAELWYRKGARGGIATFDATDMAPVRLARDPMKAAYPFLDPYLPGPIGGA